MEHCQMVFRESLIHLKNLIDRQLDLGNHGLEEFAEKLQDEAAVVASNAIVVVKETQHG